MACLVYLVDHIISWTSIVCLYLENFGIISPDVSMEPPGAP